MRAHLSEVSTNMKTGPIPVSTTCSSSCPPNCAFRGRAAGCYGAQGPVKIVWAKVDRGELGKKWDAFCKQVAALPAGQVWRHNQAGDLPGRGGRIDRAMFSELVEANRGRRGFTFTHYDPAMGDNAELVAWANRNGFTVNLSADCLAHADRLAWHECGPVVTILPSKSREQEFRTPEGRRVMVCVAERVEYMTCAICRRCQDSGRKWIVGFRAHGSCWKTVDRKFEAASRRWRFVSRQAVLEAVKGGAMGVSGVIRALGYSSVCGQTIRKVKDAAPDLGELCGRTNIFVDTGCGI